MLKMVEGIFCADYPSRVTIVLNTTVGNQSGLLSDSVVMTDNIATVEHVAIERVSGRLTMVEIDAALKQTHHL
jgi:mRNA interferase MazF